jgi:hypothetical protein
MMKLSFPLCQYYDDGWRAAYLLQIVGERGRIQPIGAMGTSLPAKKLVPLKDLKTVNGEEVAILTLPADAEEQNLKLDKERITMAEKKAAKKSKPVAKKAAKPATVKYLELQETAPETKDLKEGSHAFAVLRGLRICKGRATRERLLEVIAEEKLIKTDMDPSKAISWMTGQLVGKGYIKVVREEVAA